ncbi:MAG: A/G-specific adenine glycosylase [Candidatus Fimivivens sp.]
MTFPEDRTSTLNNIVNPLLTWYAQNARVLPWRQNTEPYRVWVSEIMLQQTQVDTVIPYYNRFLQQIPSINALAQIDTSQLLKLWEGLGYYSRARNLQKAAKLIMEKHAGQFPDALPDILALPGIGVYTAGAIASICYEQAVPAVDGNVLRVITRLINSEADITLPRVKSDITEMLRTIYPAHRCGDFTQSLMELGATVCLPNGTPKCLICPVRTFCGAFANGTQLLLPVKTKKKPRKREEKTVFLLCCGDKLAIRQRETNKLLGGLWELPNVEGALLPDDARLILKDWGFALFSLKKGQRKKHIFTHVEWQMASYIVTCEQMPEPFSWVTKENLATEFAMPSAFLPFLEQLI